MIAFALGHAGGPPTDQRHPRPGALGRHRPEPQRRVARPAPSWPVPADQPPVAGGRVCGTAEPERPTPLEARHVAVDHPGELVGFDCFHVGRLAGTTGRVWQYTAIDLASSYVWASSPRRRSTRAPGRPRPWPGGWRPTRDRRLAPRARAHRQRRASSAARRSGTRSASSGPRRPSSGRGAPPPTARSSGCSARSSRSAGGHRSPGAWCPSSPGSQEISRATCASTTRSVPTPDG